jgi:hypothetical protein
MLAAALIPLIFVVAMLVMFVLGAWPLGPIASAGIVALLVWFAVSLLRFLGGLEEQPSR